MYDATTNISGKKFSQLELRLVRDSIITEFEISAKSISVQQKFPLDREFICENNCLKEELSWQNVHQDPYVKI